MRYQQVIKQFGGITATAKLLGVQKGIVFMWSKRKRINTLHQLRLRRLSQGRLRLDKKANEELAEIISLAK